MKCKIEIMYNYNKERQKLINNQIFNLGYTFCEQCQASNAFKFHCHHIVFRGEKPGHSQMNNPLNLIILCDSCHGEFHQLKGIRNDIVNERKLHELFGTDILNK